MASGFLGASCALATVFYITRIILLYWFFGRTDEEPALENQTPK
jgi:hypothetical protein